MARHAKQRKSYTTRCRFWETPEYHGHCCKEMRDKLAERHYAVPKTFDTRSLWSSMKRLDRGLMSYHGINNEGLRDLIKARKIDAGDVITAKKKGTREALMRLLEAADDDPKFERFVDLPPELRNRVYELHFSDFRQPLYNPKNPPLTLASRLLRRESLGLFYATCTFEIRLWPNVFFRRANLIELTESLKLFLHATPAEYLANITRLQLNVKLNSHSPENKLPPVYITISEKKRAEVVVSSETPKYDHEGYYGAVCDGLRMALGKCFEKEGKNGLTKDDVLDLRRAVEVVWNS